MRAAWASEVAASGLRGSGAGVVASWGKPGRAACGKRGVGPGCARQGKRERGRKKKEENKKNKRKIEKEKEREKR